MTKLLAVFAILSASALAQNVYYVDAVRGSDSNPGTQSSPWKTINHANAAMTVPAAGVVVHVLPGTYDEAVSISKSGTPNGYIRYVSDTKWGARVTGGSSNVIWALFGRSYVEVNGFELDGAGHDTCCAVDTTSNTGLKILNNKIHDVCRQGNCSGGAIILLNADSSSTSVGGSNFVEGNFVYHNNAPGVTSSSGSSSHGIYSSRPGDTIRNNLMVQQGGGWCIHLWHEADHAVITNNTLISCDRGGIIVGNDRTRSPDVNDHTTVSNNIVANSGGNGGQYGIVEYGSSCTAVGPNNVYQNNLLFGNSPSNISLCGGKTATGTRSGSNATTFTNYTGSASGDYSLKSSSPAVSAGTLNCASGVNNCIPTIDFANFVRTTPPSIGAIERGVASNLPGAPTGLTAVVQ